MPIHGSARRKRLPQKLHKAKKRKKFVNETHKIDSFFMYNNIYINQTTFKSTFVLKKEGF